MNLPPVASAHRVVLSFAASACEPLSESWMGGCAVAEKATPVYSTAIGQVLGKTWRPEARKFVRSSSAHVRVSRSCAEL